MQWLEVVCDKVCSVRQMVHVNIHWMVCSGGSVADYVAALRRRTQQLGLKVGVCPVTGCGAAVLLCTSLFETLATQQVSGLFPCQHASVQLISADPPDECLTCRR